MIWSNANSCIKNQAKRLFTQIVEGDCRKDAHLWYEDSLKPKGKKSSVRLQSIVLGVILVSHMLRKRMGEERRHQTMPVPKSGDNH